MSVLTLQRRRLLQGALALLVASPRVSASAAQPTLTWGIDYGGQTDPQLARAYQLLVLEPDHPRPIEPLRGPGSRLLGYVSLGEIERSRPFVGELELAGALKAPNPNWPDARFADLRHPAWKRLLLERIVPEVLAKGYDGLFLDTLDNAEAMERAGDQGMVMAALGLIKAVRQRFPDITLMMNRGYALLPAAAPYVDIILGEAMASRWSFADKHYEMTSDADWGWQADQLHAAKRVHPALVLATLDYWDPADRKTVAALYRRERTAGFVPYVATLALDRLLAEQAA